MNIVGENIKKYRLANNMTQSDLAKKLGLKSKMSISDVERGKMDLTTDRVRTFAKALNCTPADLMGWDIKQVERLSAYYTRISEAFQKASEKDRKAVCTILDVPYEDEE